MYIFKKDNYKMLIIYFYRKSKALQKRFSVVNRFVETGSDRKVKICENYHLLIPDLILIY